MKAAPLFGKANLLGFANAMKVQLPSGEYVLPAGVFSTDPACVDKIAKYDFTDPKCYNVLLTDAVITEVGTDY